MRNNLVLRVSPKSYFDARKHRAATLDLAVWHADELSKASKIARTPFRQ